MSAEAPETHLFFTERMIQIAQNAGAIAIGAFPATIQGVRRVLAQRVPDYTVPGEHLAFVMQWGGRGELPAVPYVDAPANQLYWPEYHLDLSTVTHRGKAWKKARIEALGMPVIEVTIKNLKNPRFGARLAKAIMEHSLHAPGSPGWLSRANDRPACQEAAVIAQERHPLPFSVALLE